MGASSVPASVVVAYMLLGIEDIGVQIEEPFAVMPLWQYSDAIDQTARQLNAHTP